MHHFEACRRITQQPMRTGDVTSGEHEMIRALGQRVDQLAEDAAQAGEAFKRP